MTKDLRVAVKHGMGEDLSARYIGAKISREPDAGKSGFESYLKMNRTALSLRPVS